VGAHRQLARGLTAADRSRVLQALAAVGLAGFEQRWLGELSVGQVQRVLFARVLLQDAGLILLDEPFNAIDARTTADLLALLVRWRDEGRTVVAVLHDLDQVRVHFDQTLLLARETVAWGPTAEVLRAENLFRPRGRWPSRGTSARRGARKRRDRLAATLCRVRFHAPRAGGQRGAGPGLCGHWAAC
jgi:zinc/manganese transport system ATP-binding protein